MSVSTVLTSSVVSGVYYKKADSCSFDYGCLETD